MKNEKLFNDRGNCGLQNKVTNVSFYAGQSLGDTSLVKTVEVDSKSGTWISASIRGICMPL